jgi:precorrin-6B methylase 1
LLPEIEGLLKEVEVMPAELAEMFMKNEDGDVAVKVLEFLKGKKEAATDSKKKTVKRRKCWY